MSKSFKATVSVYLNPELWKRFKARAAMDGLAVSYVLEALIRAYLDRQVEFQRVEVAAQ